MTNKHVHDERHWSPTFKEICAKNQMEMKQRNNVFYAKYTQITKLKSVNDFKTTLNEERKKNNKIRTKTIFIVSFAV